MNKVVISLVMCVGMVVLQGAEAGKDLVKVHPFDGRGGTGSLSSSPAASVLGMLNSVVGGLFVTSPVETIIEKAAREMRDAVLSRNEETLYALLEKYGAAPAEVLGPDKHSAFHMACLNQYVVGIEILAGKKGQKKREGTKKSAVNIDLSNGNGCTALQVALSSGHVDVAQTLVGLGAQVEYEELGLVRKFRQEHGKEKGEVVQALAELLGNRKKEEAEKYIYDTDPEDEDSGSEGEDANE